MKTNMPVELIFFLLGVICTCILTLFANLYNHFSARAHFANVLAKYTDKERHIVLDALLAGVDKITEDQPNWAVMGIGAYLLASHAKSCNLPLAAAMELLTATWNSVTSHQGLPHE